MQGGHEGNVDGAGTNGYGGQFLFHGRYSIPLLDGLKAIILTLSGPFLTKHLGEDLVGFYLSRVNTMHLNRPASKYMIQIWRHILNIIW